MTPAEHLLAIVDAAEPVQNYVVIYPIRLTKADWLAARRLAEAMPALMDALADIIDASPWTPDADSAREAAVNLLRSFHTPTPEPPA